MPYKDRERDRAWHREYMRRKRAVVVAGVTAGVTNMQSVTPNKPESVTPCATPAKPKLVRPPGISDSEWNYRLMRAEQDEK
jgi:hypothetical protein